MKKPAHEIFVKYLYVFFLIVFLFLFERNWFGVVLYSDNNIDSESLTKAYRILINRSETRLYLYQGQELLKSYSVAVGNSDAGKSTPAGRYRITNKLKDPIFVWRSGKVISSNDPRNSYGSRWIGLADFTTGKYRGCGIQGTNVESSIGRKITVGCVRMKNEDIIELYELVHLGTEVVVR